MTPFERTFLAGQGYFELGMNREALQELDRLSPTEQMVAEVLELRILILMKEARWIKALRASESLCAVMPDAATGFIHRAFCLHELGRTRKAREVLHEGPASLRKEATYFYNLACYECVLGNHETAKELLETSLKMDPDLRPFARQDSDLAALF